VHHGGKWFKGEHKAILDRQTFERVQELLKSNSNGRRIKSSKSGALLQGKLFDDKDNLMGPSFSSKNGVRYRFYVSTALRGRKDKAGSIRRISAPEIEGMVENAARRYSRKQNVSTENWTDRIKRVVVTSTSTMTLSTANRPRRPISLGPQRTHPTLAPPHPRRTASRIKSCCSRSSAPMLG
jgi:site-specific DNA recombinase